MRYIKKYEAVSAKEFDNRKDIRYNIECLLIDLVDQGIVVNIFFTLNGLNITIDTRSRNSSRKRFTNIVDYLLSLIDYLNSVNYRYNKLDVILGSGYKEISCKIVDGKLKIYPLKNDRFIADYLVGYVKLEFTKNRMIA
jgi:hypothetical protein